MNNRTLLLMQSLNFITKVISVPFKIALFISLLFCIPSGIMYLLTRSFDILLEWFEKKLPAKESDVIYDDTEQLAICNDCKAPLTLVRPGKHQCDNLNCIQNL